MRDSRNKLTTYVYDWASRLTGKTDSLSRRIAYGYDAVVQLVTITRYSAAGSVTERVTYAFGDLSNQTLTNDTDHQYDYAFATAAAAAAGGDGDFIVTWSSYDTGGTAWNAMARRYTANDVTKITYDELHWITKIEEAYNSPTEHRTTTFAYDAAGNLLSTTDGRGTRTSFAYDNVNRVTRIDEAYNLPTEQRTTTFAYDAAGNLLSTTGDQQQECGAGPDDVQLRRAGPVDGDDEWPGRGRDAGLRRAGLAGQPGRPAAPLHDDDLRRERQRAHGRSTR